jgi:NADH:ubiquinone oxidoreductase subunit K
MSDIDPTLVNLESEAVSETTEESGKSKKLWLFIGIGVLIIALIVTGIVLLSRAGGDTTGKVRDIFIILMALESIVIGVALTILVVQLASLINLLQNEIKPILKSTNDTVNTLKGTTAFLSDNLASPVIKLNSSMAGVKKLFDLIGLFRK